MSLRSIGNILSNFDDYRSTTGTKASSSSGGGGGVAASGGTTATANGYKYHFFTHPTSDDFVVTSGGNIEFIVIGGGGAGGSYRGAGGGAGGVNSNWPGFPGSYGGTSYAVTSGTYPITVGDGGATGPASGSSGSTSVFNGPGVNSGNPISGSGGGGGASDNRSGGGGGQQASNASAVVSVTPSNGGGGGDPGGTDGGGGGGGGGGDNGGGGGGAGQDNNRGGGGGRAGGSTFSSGLVGTNTATINSGQTAMDGYVSVTWTNAPATINSFTASPNPQNSSNGVRQYTTRLSWSTTFATTLTLTSNAGESWNVTGSTFRDITNLPQSNANGSSPAQRTTQRLALFALMRCFGGLRDMV
mgnify:CR=1 FL=1